MCPQKPAGTRRQVKSVPLSPFPGLPMHDAGCWVTAPSPSCRGSVLLSSEVLFPQTYVAKQTNSTEESLCSQSEWVPPDRKMYISTLLCRLRTYLIFAPSHTHKRFPSPWRVLHGSQGSCSARSLELQGKRAGNGSEDASRKAPASRASLSFCIPQSPRTGRVAFRTRGRCALRHPPFKKNK